MKFHEVEPNEELKEQIEACIQSVMAVCQNHGVFFAGGFAVAGQGIASPGTNLPVQGPAIILTKLALDCFENKWANSAPRGLQ